MDWEKKCIQIYMPSEERLGLGFLVAMVSELDHHIIPFSSAALLSDIAAHFPAAMTPTSNYSKSMQTAGWFSLLLTQGPNLTQ